MTTRALLTLAAALALLGCDGAERARPEHVALIVIDTLRADHLGAYGHERPTSPAIDALARRGALFETAIAQCSWTSPSMISLMTGRYIAKERLDVPQDLATLAESFQRAGFATGGFASNPLITAEYGFARGFDRFEAIDEHGSNEPITKWLERTESARTFTYVHFNEPHDPYLAPEGQREWREANVELPGDRAQFYERVTRELGLTGFDENVARIREEIGGYDDDVRYADARVAEILALYEARGLADRTLFVVTADHGEGLWEHVALMNGQRGTKLAKGEAPSLMNALMPTHGNQVHRELVHVPLVLAGPGVPAGCRVADPVENVDLFPTLLDLCGLPRARGLQGASLVPLLAGGRAAKDTAFSFTRFNVTVIDAAGWALILPTDEGVCAEALEVELYDLERDPHQRTNLAAARPEVVERLSEVAHERMRIGIRTAGAVSEGDVEALAGLGYTDQAARAAERLRLASIPVGDVVAELAKFETPCTQRLLAAESLAGREIDAESRERLVAWRAKETSAAVIRALDELLAK